ncbi:MAG: type IV pilin [Halobacterium sp.]
MDARGQTEVIGVVLLLAITVVGVGVVVATAGGALDAAQDRSAVQRAEQSMSLFDARSALVALGRSGSQSVSLARSEGGSYEVRPDTGRIVVARTTNNSTTEYVNTSLGSVVFERGNAEVAYQGGGVWRSVGAGSEMVSPPEFNYRDATLTLPIIVVAGGSDAAAGGPTARVTPVNVAEPVFPNATLSNPLSEGNVTVSVQSDYYRGWASYFRQRTTGNVTVYESNQTVELELIARGSGGAFTLEETPLELRGLASDDPIEDLSFTLKPNKNSDFSDLDWSLVADNGGSERFEVNVQGADVCNGKQPDVTVEYTDGGTTHTWENNSAFTKNGSTFSYSCDADNDPTMYLNLTGPTNQTYQGASPPLSNNSTGYIVNYYLAEMGPNVDLKVLSKGKQNPPGNSASTDLDASTGNIQYSTSGSRVVTFLHITKNTVNVSLN